ncbi:MAG: hypothetical protein ACK5LY_04945 [Lachnospirales bacterium]
MLGVSQMTIYSIDEDFDMIEVEGEVVFDNDHTCDFTCTINTEDNTIENLEFDIDTDEIDMDDFKAKVQKAAKNYED